MPSFSRRAFLAASAAAATAAVLPSRRLHAAVQPPGLQLYSVREFLPKDYAGTLAKVAAAGYRDVEAAGFYDHSAAEVKQIMSDAGLRCISAHYPLADLLQATDATLDYASTLGLEYVICASPSLADPSKAANYPGGAWEYMHNAATADDWKWNAEQFDRLGEKFQGRKIQFGYHNHTAEFRDLDNGLNGYQVLLERTNPKLVVFELDCGWAIAAGQDAAKLIREHSARITMLHLKDFAAAAPGAPAEQRTPVPIGYGVIDFKPILAAAADAEIAHAFIEQEDYDRPPFEELKLDYDNLNTLASGGSSQDPAAEATLESGAPGRISYPAHAATPLLLTLLLCAARAFAQAGPPFRTDDPETPGNHHWEINFGFIADHNPADSYYQTPDFDINYGWGDRIQLKYELPISEHTDSADTTDGGLGNSLLGVKWRYYEHRRADAKPDDDKAVNFSLSTYPQLSLDNPTGAVRRGVVQYRGPQFLLPLEANARIGWLRLDGEVGHWFGNRDAPDQWIRGLIAGHEFTEKTELYAEIYDQQDANRIDGAPKQREATLDLGGRHALNHDNTLNLLFMAGRSFQAATATSGQPNWIAYIGLQVLLGPKEPNAQVEKKLPDEDSK